MRENNYAEHLFGAAGVKFQLSAAPVKTVPVPGAARCRASPGCAVPARAGVHRPGLVAPLPFCELQMATVPGNAKCLV